MAFLAVGVLALGSAGSLYWWGWPDATIEAIPIAPHVESLNTTVIKINAKTVVKVDEPNLIDELKIALAARRARRAPGTCQN